MTIQTQVLDGQIFISGLKEPQRNTDREIWRGPDDGTGSAYADSLHVTKDGALGINCGGSVHVRPIREWHRLAGAPSREVWRTDDGPGVYTLHIKRAASDLRPTADCTDVLSRSELVAYLRKEDCPSELVDIVSNFP